MSDTDTMARFGVSLSRALLARFDRHIKTRGYTNRSEALRDLMRTQLVAQEWQENEEVAGAITLLYDHHQRDLLAKATDLQHRLHHVIISTQHVHLDHDTCFEIIAVKGRADDVMCLCDSLRALKGIAHCSLSMASTGKAFA